MTCITTIKEQVKKIIEYSQGFPVDNIDALIDKWHENKAAYIEQWGGTIYESSAPVTFYLSPDEKRARFNEFIDVIDNTYGNYDLTSFLDWLQIEEVFENRLSRDYWLTDDDKIPEGAKVSKAFKYFIDNEHALRTIQDRISMIMQEDKIVGTLCLSVDPRDYLSVSENVHHWRSCHALDGDYRSGNLQYMVDKNTIVCYLRGADGQKLPHFPADVPWNSKKWRMLLFLSDTHNAMFAGRQYPFFSPSAMDVTQELFLNSMNKRVRSWTPWYNDFIRKFPRANEDDYYNERDIWLFSDHISMGSRIFPIKDVIVEPENTLFFNDLLESSCYKPYYSWNRYANNDFTFHIGDTAPCPRCGKRDVGFSEMMMCRTCFNEKYKHDEPIVRYCECCERRADMGEEFNYVMGAGVLLCDDCFERMTTRCERCGHHWYTQDIRYDYDMEQHLCPLCRAETSEDFEFDETLPF